MCVGWSARTNAQICALDGGDPFRVFLRHGFVRAVVRVYPFEPLVAVVDEQPVRTSNRQTVDVAERAPERLRRKQFFWVPRAHKSSDRIWYLYAGFESNTPRPVFRIVR